MLGVVCLMVVAWGSSSSLATVPTGSVLRVADLPAGWIVDRSELVGSTPPCIASAEAPLKSFPEKRVAFAGETDHLAELSERVISVPSRVLNSKYTAVLRRYRACNRSTWTRATDLTFLLSITRRRALSVGKVHVAAFSVSLSSPSGEVEPNPYPGLVDFAVVGDKVVIVSMQFAEIPVDPSMFDSIETTAVSSVS
jgi:hypothetical protein